MSYRTPGTDDAALQLAARVDLACATVSLCDVYRGMLLRRWEADERGEDTSVAARAQMIQDHYGREMAAFLAAWRRGISAIENMHAIETAVRGYCTQFNVDDHTQLAGLRMLLDFMRGATRSLPDPAQTAVTRENRDYDEDVLRQLEACLDGLLAIWRTVAGGHYGCEAVQAASEAAERAVVTLLDHGYGLGRMQIMLDWWSEAVHGPRIEIQMLDPLPIA